VTLKAWEFERIARKLDLKTRNAGDRLAWFEYAGKTILHTKRSHKAGDLPFSHAIRQQLKLSESQFRDLKNCPLDRKGYIAILRTQGLIPPELSEEEPEPNDPEGTTANA
jgi:hypothetical protein